MHDAFRHASRARRKQDVYRMIERQLLELERLRRVGLDEILQRERSRHLCSGFPGITESGHNQDCSDRSKPISDSSNLVSDGNEFAVIQIAIDADEDFRLNLSETVEHAVLAEIRRAGRKDRTEGGDRKH